MEQEKKRKGRQKKENKDTQTQKEQTLDRLHWKSLQNPLYTGHYTLVEKGLTELEVTITNVTREDAIDTSGVKKQATLLHMEGLKPLWLNSVNQKTIERVTGSPFINDWIGKKITLYVDKVKINDTHGLASVEDMFVDAIRIREYSTKNDAEVLTKDHPRFYRIKDGIEKGSVTIAQIKSKYIVDEQTEYLLTGK